uniref:RNase H type-1 domain-containing protein n=1 Tax=Oryza rufipogon TaxID=4529 RepID=A0A0E0PXD0_ORYRU
MAITVAVAESTSAKVEAGGSKDAEEEMRCKGEEERLGGEKMDSLDNADVVQALTQQVASRFSWPTTVAEIKGVIQCIQRVQMHKIEREANRVAHVLAQMAISTRSCGEWRLCAPHQS